MVLITEELVRKRSEHNERVISTMEEVSLHQEDIEKIEHLQNWCRDLKILLLQSNLISKIENLNKMKNLEYLNLALNNIEVIENLEGCESLQKLDLTLNFIGELSSVERLKSNRHLQHLYLSGNPCTDYEGYREYVIATLPQLCSLDSVEIERSDRIKALQSYGVIKPVVIAEQIEYKKRREKQKAAAENKNRNISTENTLLTAEESEKFWKEMSDNTPETRIELAKHSRRSQQPTETAKKDSTKRKIQLFNKKDGKPNNVNEAKIPFSFEDDEEQNCFVLTLEIYKYLDTSLLDVDIQPQYVTVRVKGKVFQLTLTEEVEVARSTALRSQTTGYLVITMPKMKGELKPKSVPKPPSISKEHQPPTSNIISKRQYLEIGKDDRMDFSKIVEKNHAKENQVKSRIQVKEKQPPEDFEDNPDVPPLE